ncbi:MAG: BglII/BstYI family type II restriction endonuclease [Mycobacteriales bacterium]
MSDRHDDDATDLVQAGVSAPAGSVRAPTVTGLPKGYIYGVTRYADVILEQSFARQYAGLVKTLEGFEIELAELQAGGGNRAPFVARFDVTLERYGWGKRNITIGKTIDGVSISEVRGHEIDMFATGSDAESYPGIAVEMEWNNKDPFFDRDLLNFQALHPPCTGRAHWRSGSSSRAAPLCRSY